MGAVHWWETSSPHSYLDAFKSSGIGVYGAANWDEGATKYGAMFTYRNLRPHSKLVLGPASHCNWRAVRDETGFDIVVEELRFFDYWLKGIRNGVMDEPPVTYYTYNAPPGGEWGSAPDWPLPEEMRVRYFLGPILDAAAPAAGDARDVVTVDYDLTPENRAEKAFSYVSAPLARDLQVTGHPILHLWVAASSGDADFFATLEDLAPDGTAVSHFVDGQLRASLDYGPPQGRAELREVLAERLRRTRGIDADAARIVITSGSPQALDLVTRVLLDAGDRVLLEEPHYLGARWVFEAAGAELVPAEVDDQGMRVPETTSGATAPRLAYTTPSHQFPTGVVMPLSRRLALLEWAACTDAFVLEDDYDSEYRYDGRPLQALAGLDGGGRVIYVGTLSKLMFPALRLGYIVVPDSLYDTIVAAKALADTGCSALTQLTLADFIRDGHFDRHLQRTRARNAARRATLLAAIETHFGDRAEVSGAAAGLHVLVWLRSRNGRPIRSIGRRAESAGIGLYAVAPYYLHPPAARSGVLLGSPPSTSGRFNLASPVSPKRSREVFLYEVMPAP